MVDWRKALDITLVMVVVAIVILLIFAGLNSGFNYLRKQLSANVISSHQQVMIESIDNAFSVILSVIFFVLMAFILIQILGIFKKDSNKTIDSLYHNNP